MDSTENRITLLVQGCKFSCDKHKLIQCSDYFRAMFSDHFSERQKDTIELQDIDPDILRLLLDYAETGKFSPKQETLFATLEVSSMLQFTYIQNICAGHLRSTLSPSTCLSTHRITSLHGIIPVAKASWTMALWNFADVVRSEEFLKYSFAELETYIGDRSLNTGMAGEWAAWEAIEAWIRYDERERIAFHLPLVSLIDFQSLSEDDISTMMFYSFVDSSESVKVLLEGIKSKKRSLSAPPPSGDSAFGEHPSSERVPPQPSTSSTVDVEAVLARPRRKLSQIACVVGFKEGQLARGIETFPTLYGFDPESCTIEETVSLSVMSEPSYCQGYKICSVGPRIYILGGEYLLGYGNWNKNVWSFDTVTEKWIIEGPLSRDRRHHMCCVINSTIYLIGGYGKHRIMLSSMDAYDTDSGNWRACRDMPGTVNRGAVCAFDQKIFVFTNCELFIYEPARDLWVVSRFSSTHANGFYAAFPYKQDIFLIGDITQKVFRMRVRKNHIIEDFGRFENPIINACLVGSKIYSFSHGSDKSHVIESLDLDSQSEEGQPGEENVGAASNRSTLNDGLVAPEEIWREEQSGPHLFSHNRQIELAYSFGCFPLFKI